MSLNELILGSVQHALFQTNYPERDVRFNFLTYVLADPIEAGCDISDWFGWP